MNEVYPAEIVDEPMPGYLPPPAPGLESPYYGPDGVQVGRGQYASSFVAPHVDDWGRTLSPAVYDPRELESAAAADRARARWEFDDLIKGGATPPEAFMKTAHLWFSNDPARLAHAMENMPSEPPKMPFVPTKVQDGENTLWQLGPNRWQLQGPPKVPIPKMPQDVADERKLIEGRLRMIQNDQFNQKSTPADMPPLEARYKELGTNWQTRPPALTLPMPGAPTQSFPPMPTSPPPAENKADSAETVRAQFRAGKLSREEAKQQLKALGYD